jgi:threonine aldolase
VPWFSRLLAVLPARSINTPLQAMVPAVTIALLASVLVCALPRVSVAPAETNIVVASLQEREAPAVVAALRADGVLGTAMDAHTIRFVTHRDVSREDCERAAAAIGRVLAA